MDGLRKRSSKPIVKTWIVVSEVGRNGATDISKLRVMLELRPMHETSFTDPL